MNKRHSLKSSRLEKKLFTAYHQDGILDLVAGFMILAFALVILFDQNAYVGLIAIPAALYFPLKQKVTFPRLGVIRFSPEKEQRRKLNLSMLFGLTTLLGLVVFYIFAGDLPESIVNRLRENMPLLFGGVFSLILLAVAYFLNNSRFYIYAVLGLATVWIAHFLNFSIGSAVGILGCVVEITAWVLLARFLSDYKLDAKSQE